MRETVADVPWEANLSVIGLIVGRDEVRYFAASRM